MKNEKWLIEDLSNRNNTTIIYEPRNPHIAVAKKILRDSNNGLKIPVGFSNLLNTVSRKIYE